MGNTLSPLKPAYRPLLTLSKAFWIQILCNVGDNVFGVAKGLWKGEGVLAPEALPSKPFIERMEKYGFPPFVTDYDSEYKLAADKEAALKNMKMQRWGMHETMDKTEKQQGGDLFQQL